MAAALRRPETALLALALWMVGLGLFFRLCYFGYPNRYQFDEHHFVDNARNYQLGRPDGNDHPPLGKLFILLSMRAFGDSGVGWRVPSLIFGGLSLALAAVAAARLFRSRRAGLLAAAFLAADGFLISYSRAALLDGTLAAMALASLVAASLSRPRDVALMGGLAAGVAMSTKFSGLGALVAPLVSLALHPADRRRRLGAAVALVALAGAVYVGAYLAGLRISGRPATIAAVVADSLRLVQHHAVLTDMKNPATSSWPTWVLPARPLVLGYGVEHGMVRALTTLGNLALWWSGCALALLATGVLAYRGLAWALEPRRETAPARTPAGNRAARVWRAAEVFVGAHGRAAVLVLAAAGAFLAPWVISHRDSYIYHFLPSYALVLLLLAGFVSHAFDRNPLAVIVFLALVTLVAGFYGPLWCYVPVSERGFETRLFLGAWR